MSDKSVGLGIAGFVLAIIGMFFCWIPTFGLGLLGLGFILSLIQLIKNSTGLAIAGLIISIIFLIPSLIITNTAINFFDSISNIDSNFNLDSKSTIKEYTCDNGAKVSNLALCPKSISKEFKEIKLDLVNKLNKIDSFYGAEYIEVTKLVDNNKIIEIHYTQKDGSFTKNGVSENLFDILRTTYTYLIQNNISFKGIYILCTTSNGNYNFSRYTSKEEIIDLINLNKSFAEWSNDIYEGILGVDVITSDNKFNLDYLKQYSEDIVAKDFAIDSLTSFKLNDDVIIIEIKHSNWVESIILSSMFDLLQKETNYLVSTNSKYNLRIIATTPMGAKIDCLTTYDVLEEVNNQSIGQTEWGSLADCKTSGQLY